MTSILRKPNESLEDYHIRLFENKEEYGIDKFQITDLLNKEADEEYSESKWRKDYAQYLKWKDYILSKNLDGEILDKYEKIRIEAEKEKIRRNDQRREYNKYIRNQARFEGLRDDIIRVIEEINIKKPLVFNDKPTYDSEREGLVLFSDWHYGMVIDNSINKFNKEVFDERVAKLVNRTIEHGIRNEISTLHVANLGDLVGGLIHVSTRVEANEDVIGQIKYVAETLSEVLAKFANTFNKIEFYNICGNHGRTIANKNDGSIKENFEYLLLWYLQARLSGFNNITFTDEKDGYIVTKIKNKDVVFVHGHYDKPEVSVTKIPQLIGLVPDYIFSGHIHHHFEKEFGKTTCIVNSSLIGADDYAMQGRFSSVPAQKLLIFNDDDLESTYNIKL